MVARASGGRRALRVQLRRLSIGRKADRHRYAERARFGPQRFGKAGDRIFRRAIRGVAENADQSRAGTQHGRMLPFRPGLHAGIDRAHGIDRAEEIGSGIWRSNISGGWLSNVPGTTIPADVISVPHGPRVARAACDCGRYRPAIADVGDFRMEARGRARIAPGGLEGARAEELRSGQSRTHHRRAPHWLRPARRRCRSIPR